jgi:threonine dehydrogenase-like Zn-dependent dehydrogenase
MLADGGYFILIGDPGYPEELSLTSDLLLKGLHIVGVHDGNHHQVWGAARITELFFSLCLAGKFDTASLMSMEVPATQIPLLYRTLRSHSGNIGMAVRWE